MAFAWLPSPSVNAATPPFSLVFLPSRRRRLFTRDDEGEDAEEEVDVTELGFAFLDFNPAGLAKEDGGAARLLRLPILARSLPRPPRESGSEQGLRNGDRLSLSLQKTTAIEPPTTELPAPPPVPPDPRSSMPNFPEPTDAPVVLLTPSRTSTDTLDCSLPLRLPPVSFLDLPERPDSFLLPFSRSLSFPSFLVRFVEGTADEMGTEPEVTDSEEKSLLLVLTEEEEDDSD